MTQVVSVVDTQRRGRPMKDVYVSLLLQAQIKVTVCKNPILL
jgi:hypothetical protein